MLMVLRAVHAAAGAIDGRRRRRSAPLRIARPALLALVAVALAGAPAGAETRRVAVVVGHNSGGVVERPLRYAEDDAAKLADVLAELGDIDRSQLFLVRGRGRDEVLEALRRATVAVKAARRSPDDRVVLVFFYSGHSNVGALQLGDTMLAYAELKRLLAATGAEVRLTIVDGCKSGGLVAAKGGRPGPAFEIGLADQLSSVGEATLTSSAADEQSLESGEIRGSFFTHHLVSGLRGAADSSGDGRVTLTEAYEYAFNHTVVASAATGSPPQHPNYDYQLSGGGELILTKVGVQSARLRLPEDFARALIVNVRRDQVIAELSSGKVRSVAVAPGEYAVRLWKKQATYVGRVTALADQVTEVGWAQLKEAAQLPRTDKGGGGDDATAAELAEAKQILLDNALEARRVRERLDGVNADGKRIAARSGGSRSAAEWEGRGDDSESAYERTATSLDDEHMRRRYSSLLDDGLDAKYARYGRVLSPSAQAAWDAQVLTVQGPISFMYQGKPEVSETRLYVGRDGRERPGRREIDPKVFLRVVGRPELAERMESRFRLRVGLVVSGTLLALGALAYGTLGEECVMGEPGYGSCSDERDDRKALGIGGALVGSGLVITGALLPSGLPEPRTLHELADRHNRELRGQLGAGKLPPPEKASSLRLLPVMGPSGGGMALTGRF